MNITVVIWCLGGILLAAQGAPLFAHAVNYQVQKAGMAVRVFYGPEEPAAYSEFEVFGPQDENPHAIGRTDKNGFVAFVPDRPGVWTVQTLGESPHGYHGVTVEVRVDEDLSLASFKKPLLATHTKLVTGVSLMVGVFGILAFILSRRRSPT